MSRSYGHHFSRRNIPFGIASSAKHPDSQAATRVQDSVIFLHDCHSAGLFSSIDLPANVFRRDTLNDFAALPKPTHRSVRQLLQNAVRDDDSINIEALPAASVEHVDQVTMHMSVRVGDFTGMARRPPSVAGDFSNMDRRLLVLPRARQERRAHHHQRRKAPSGLLQPPHRIPGPRKLHRRVRHGYRTADGAVP
jgi:hypothetical protein